MSLSLTTDLVLISVVKRVKNARDEVLGEIMEITRDESGEFIKYAILKFDPMHDQKQRYFAIPVISHLIKISEAGNIILLIDKEEFDRANRISPEICPSPVFHMNPAIFEMIQYHGPVIQR